MEPTNLSLKVLIPFEIFTAKSNVLRIIAEAPMGSFGVLPRRRDCVTTLTPGILLFETERDGETFVAIDKGILVKAGSEVLVCVRRAIAGNDLNKLRESVAQEFLTLNEEEQSVRAAMARLETGFLRRLASFHEFSNE